MNKLIIIGAGGHGRVVADVASRTKRWSLISFLDDNFMGKCINGFEVIDSIQNYERWDNSYDFFVAIGDNSNRKKFVEEIGRERKIVSIIDPSAIISSHVIIGKGTIIMPNAIINCNVSIGQGCIINSAALIEHDCRISDFSHISPSVALAGNVFIGYNSWIGIGTIVKNNVEICDNVTTGAGSVVVNNISDPGIYIGIPAKRYIK